MTQAEYIAFLARQRRPDADAPRGNGVSEETPLHNDILTECARRGWIAFHGSMAHRTFRTPGEPDFVILADRGRALLIECKTKTGKLTTDQQAIAAWAYKLGHKVHVVRSMEDFHSLTMPWVDAGE